ncbi:MAG: 3-hydroxyacyl-CoA dehydrogenase NAD-binding domain-containing protein [Rubrivivax sp.]|nr:3-hydroxyacyl-CoA dehydrogenase NAD-binding domain-containing protein [Rubrivivax sp.]
MDKQNPKVLIVGGGVMGCGIAAGLAAHACDVVLLVREAARCEAALRETRALLASLGAAPRADAAPASLSVQTLDAFADWGDLSLVIETVKEDLAVKQQLFAWLDGRVPAGVPIGSNSSGFPISRIAQGLATRSRMFGTHYFMPAHRVPLVEVVLGADSDVPLAHTVCAMFSAAGKKPVLVRRDIPGFLANRIQHALMREVLSLIDSGIASPEDIDLAVRYSFGFRYAAIGPVLQKEISGWDSVAQAAREIYPSLSNARVLPACLERLLEEGKLGMKTGEGFLAWTPQSAQAVRAAYDGRLAAALRLLE